MYKVISRALSLLLILDLTACSVSTPTNRVSDSENIQLIQSNKETIHSQKISLNLDWKFIKITNQNDQQFHSQQLDTSEWQSAQLPHTANIEPLVVNDQWQGISWYRKQFSLPAELEGKKLFIELEAAMNHSQIWINDQLVSIAQGGYLPVIIDATAYLNTDKLNTIAVRLDNKDNPVTGPKPLKILDFNMYGGIYRNAWLTVKEPVYITNPNLVDKVAGGGIFVTSHNISHDSAEVKIKTHIQNDNLKSHNVTVKQTIYHKQKQVKVIELPAFHLAQSSDRELVQSFTIAQPQLWSPDTPNLYQLKTQVFIDGKLSDIEETTFGIREFKFVGQDLYLNGEKIYLRGVNRHQEYPFIGYALSDNAHYRDAKKIKDAGFNHVRLSHYPHSPAFMKACDELGLVVLDAILGWQYYADTDAFRNQTYQTAKQLIRRDRNHTSVLGWEVSLNETLMPIFYMEEMHRIVHSEFPGENVYSAGWMDDVYDIYLQARQHKIKHKGMHNDDNKPYMVSEYGDWEYYSNNAGLNQHKMPKDERLKTSSRQLREYGEARLLQQALNVQEAHNDNFTTPAYGDGYWVMYDYNRGYHDEIESSGLMDIFRLPKFAYYFYQSQTSPLINPMVSIASYWNEKSPLDLKVYSNGDKVNLFLNGKLIASQKPDSGKNTEHLDHPPFTFSLKQFEAGTLKAVSYLNGKIIAEDTVHTPGQAVEFKIWVDESGKPATSGQNDSVFVYIAAVDAKGVIVPDYSETINFELLGDAKLINVETIKAEAGIATALLQIGNNPGTISIKVGAKNLNTTDFSFKTL